jgi:hypothetical protein
MIVNVAADGNQRALLLDLLLVLSMLHVETTLFTGVGYTFIEVSLSMTQ